MADTEPLPSFTSAQQAALDVRIADQDRTLASIHQLEAALAAPAPGNEASWLSNVRSALKILDDVTRAEVNNAALPDSLLSDIKRSQPILASRVRGVRAQYQQVRDAIASLRGELERPDDDRGPDYADTRQRLAWILVALRHQRARESDLIYEAYYDAFRVDLDNDASK
jgi:hypothetical protein